MQDCADDQTWPIFLGQHGIGKLNDCGQRLLQLWVLHDLYVINIYIQAKAQHKFSWRSPRNMLRIWSIKAPIVIQTNPRFTANSDCNQRGYITPSPHANSLSMPTQSRNQRNG